MNLTEQLIFEPLHFSVPAPWAGHISFAHWLISTQQPALFVELGAYSGISYMSFCQSIAQNKLATKAWAIDTWQGDPHAGFYSDSIYTGLRDKHNPLYGHFSTLHRSTFDDAVGHFADGSIDLLHIDGLHTYEAVKHDFETWQRKLSARAVVLFHDTHVFHGDFGVHRLWREVEQSYPSINFKHSNGLGVLLVGPDQPPALKYLCTPSQQASHLAAFAKLGERFETRAQRMQLDNQMADLQSAHAQEQQAGQKRHEWITQQDQKILEMTRQLSFFDAQKVHLDQTQQQLATAQENLSQLNLELQDQQNAITQFKQQSESSHQALQEALSRQHALHAELQTTLQQSESLRQERMNIQNLYDNAQQEMLRTQQQLNQEQQQLFTAQNHILALDHQIATILSTKSWRWTAGLRHSTSMLRHTRRFVERGFKVLNYLRKGEFRTLKSRMAAFRQDRRLANMLSANGASKGFRFGVLTPPHTLFLAQLIASRLEHHGWSVDIHTSDLDHYDHDFYFVLCPQIFKNLPPGEKRIVYQLEQSVSSRWFTEDYLSLLNNSLFVLDYNLDNIRFLSDKGIQFPLVYYMPIGCQAAQSLPAAEQPFYDVLFYGDSYSSPRRQRMLHALQQHHKVEVINEVFGDAMRAKIAQAKLVINLHYYDNALLETPRLQECLSLGVRVVSESASNQHEFPQLEGVVRFFQEGSIPDMLKVVQEALDQPVSDEAMRSAAQFGETQFNFYMDRLLLGMDLIGNTAAKAMVLPVPPQTRLFCLSLPETPSRRDLFLPEQPANCFVYDGLRKSPGWVGCGLSYASLARHALEQGLDSITVMEDDVILPPNFEDELALVQRYLDKHNGQWDIFCGLIASVHPNTQVLHVEVFEGRTFVTIDKMTSTVFNVYNRKFLRILESWDSDDRDSSRNTIDRFIQHKDNLRIVVQLPFLVGHREEVDSTLWGFQNTRYNDWISESQKTLQSMAETALQSNHIAPHDTAAASDTRKTLRFGILTTTPTRLVAEKIAKRLEHHGWSAIIQTSATDRFDLDFYFVLDAQAFIQMPPGEKRIIYQLAPSISADPALSADYFSLLNNSLSVLEHELHNIRVLADLGIAYPHVFYVPIHSLQNTTVTLNKSETVDLNTSHSHFNFYLDRFLMGMDLLGNAAALDMVLPLPAQSQRICLSLPETPARRDCFLAERPDNCVIFDGLRKKPSWVGCGLSYASLARHAMRNQLDTLTVMEDDVILPDNFEAELAIVHRYLAQFDGPWDIFAGLIASVHPDTEILGVETFEGRTFVTINKMTSMVFNIYSRSFLEILSTWNSDNHDAANNTIDRFIEENTSLRIVVQLPFLAGHREEVNSTLWGFQNTQYSDLIQKSQTNLEALVADRLIAEVS